MKNIGQKWFRRSLGLLKVINCCLQLVEAVSAFGRGFELSNLIEQKAEDPSGANRQLKWKQGPWLFSFFGGIALPICMAILIFVVNNQASIESRADFFRGSTPLFLGLFTLWIVQKSSWPTSWYCMVDIPFLDRFFCTSQGVIVGIFPSIKRYTLFFLQLRLNNFQLATFLVLQSHT